ncbi:hypothetical protein ACLG6S_15445 [Thermodesulfobacteriota bacterium B35]
MTTDHRTMICVSTRQNTANLVPFLQLGCDTMLIMETEHAQQKGWSSGLKSVLKKRGKQARISSLGAGTDLAAMVARIEELANVAPSVCWNIGGGQKMQQMALMRVFQERLNRGQEDLACYADPGAGKLFLIEGDGERIVSREKEILTDIVLDEVLTVFQLEKRERNNPLLLWQRSKHGSLPVAGQFRDMSHIRDVKKRQALLQWSLKNQGDVRKNDTPEILQGLKHGFADYFEQLVQCETANLLQEHAEQHHVTEAWANVRVKDAKGKEVAEWDVVLVTDYGTLVILDAKTGIFHSKDEDARLFNLDRATGVYGGFWLVIPYFYEDMKDNGFYAGLDQKGKELRSIPFRLNELNSRFLAISEDESTFYLTRVKKKRRQRVHLSKEHPGANGETLTIRNFRGLLQELRLLRTTV